ncbi:hypothetical protein [Mesobacillus foraminis]|uniref:hypothetical protein n=1 Tax=Mesobacillus foraminis TaxID=279826 RepID=UPI00130486D1|nr:hypothetical protein [Mesobacillus foraminis]
MKTKIPPGKVEKAFIKGMKAKIPPSQSGKGLHQRYEGQNAAGRKRERPSSRR